MRKFISPVLRKWIKVATLLLFFVVFLHSSKEGKNLGAESKALFVATDTVRVSGFGAIQVDEPAVADTGVAYAYVLPAIVIGRVRFKF